MVGLSINAVNFFGEVNSDAGISLLSQRRLIYHSVQNVKPYTTADRKDSV